MTVPVIVDNRGETSEVYCVFNTSYPVPDESVGRQDLPLDEAVANTLFVRLL